MEHPATPNTLTGKALLAMGFMTFALFLGAGNMIFPVLSGQLAGTEVWSAAAGFLVTGVGLPLLGIIAMARVGGGFNDLSQDLPPRLIALIGIIIYLLIGPLYAVPRTAAVSFEIGITPFLDTENSHSDAQQLLFSLVFFAIAWWFSLYPGKLMETVGEIITPALILLLIVLGVTPFINPAGDPGPPTEDYQATAFIQGFLDGYMTMDALAALMFGIVIITNLRSHGITNRQALTRYCIATGVIAAIGLSLVYIALFNIGSTSRVLAPDASNGGQILTTFVEYQFSQWGILILAAIVTLACLTTAIGCITAVAEYFEQLWPRYSYFSLVTAITVACVVMANINLDQLIEFYIPILLAIYPVAMILILLALIREWLPAPKLSARFTLFLVALFGIADGLHVLPYRAIEYYLLPLNNVPGFSLHLSWVLPAIVSLIITSLIGFFGSDRQSQTESNSGQ